MLDFCIQLGWLYLFTVITTCSTKRNLLPSHFETIIQNFLKQTFTQQHQSSRHPQGFDKTMNLWIAVEPIKWQIIWQACRLPLTNVHYGNKSWSLQKKVNICRCGVCTGSSTFGAKTHMVIMRITWLVECGAVLYIVNCWTKVTWTPRSMNVIPKSTYKGHDDRSLVRWPNLLTETSSSVLLSALYMQRNRLVFDHQLDVFLSHTWIIPFLAFAFNRWVSCHIIWPGYWISILGVKKLYSWLRVNNIVF